MTPHAILLDLYRAAVAAANPYDGVLNHVPDDRPKGRRVIIAFGKASIAMAQAAIARWDEATALAICPHDLSDRADPILSARMTIMGAGHPLPDRHSEMAGRTILRLTRALTVNDLALFLVSGGGSALACVPGGILSLADKQNVTQALLHSGAPIHAMNCVRKHLSAIKGGHLAAACAAPSLTLAISDVSGDDPSVIASGPTWPDDTTRADATDILSDYDIPLSSALRNHLASPAAETPKRGDPCFARAEYRIVVSAAQALKAAGARARSHGLTVIDLGDAIGGDAAQVACAHAKLALSLAPGATQTPTVILSGGETQVALDGRDTPPGGRNSHYALALAQALDGHPNIYALAADTDGIDGKGGHAGAFIDPSTLDRAAKAGRRVRDDLSSRNSYRFFEAIDDLLITGPSGTNVNDFRAVLIM